MKHLLYSSLLLLLFSCNNSPADTLQTDQPDTTAAAVPQQGTVPVKSRICWKGTLNGKIEIMLQYDIEGKVVEGELVYLNTKGQKPIKIIGTVEEDKSLRLLEFEPSGNITGILTGTPTASTFEGNWFSPLTRKELSMQLQRVDTVIPSQNITLLPASPEGSYSYQYSEEGSQGTLQVKRAGNGRISFEIFSVTDAPARNMADVSLDTAVLRGNTFTYTIPGTDDCEFKVSFFKNFAYIQYTKGYCNGVFGHNASVDGIFYKKHN